MSVTDPMQALLVVEQIEEDLFCGQSHDMGISHVFGGQVLCQSLTAAGRTVQGACSHSMHGYFLLPGDCSAPVLYQVERIRDGRSFASRRVVASQRGRTIFVMLASFHAEEPGFDHQTAVPGDPPDPNSLSNITDFHKSPGNLTSWSTFWERLQLEVRPVHPSYPYAHGPLPPSRTFWFRSRGQLPDDPAYHRCLLSYASDLGMLTTAGFPHDVMTLIEDRAIHAASLDHSIWFIRDFDLNDWLLYAIESPSAFRARGLSLGNIFTRQGKLVASTAQECLLRRVNHR